jgi:hypothetical protein
VELLLVSEPEQHLEVDKERCQDESFLSQRKKNSKIRIVHLVSCRFLTSEQIVKEGRGSTLEHIVSSELRDPSHDMEQCSLFHRIWSMRE